MYFFWQLKRLGLKRDILTGFYRFIIESTLSFSTCVVRWYASTARALAGQGGQDRGEDHQLQVASSGVDMQGVQPLPRSEDPLRRSTPSSPSFCGVATWETFSLDRSQDGSFKKTTTTTTQHMSPSCGSSQQLTTWTVLVLCIQSFGLVFSLAWLAFLLLLILLLLWLLHLCNTYTLFNGDCQPTE